MTLHLIYFRVASKLTKHPGCGLVECRKRAARKVSQVDRSVRLGRSGSEARKTCCRSSSTSVLRAALENDRPRCSDFYILLLACLSCSLVQRSQMGHRARSIANSIQGCGISKLALIGLIDTIAWINNLFTELSSKIALRAIEAVRMRASGKGSQNGIKE